MKFDIKEQIKIVPVHATQACVEVIVWWLSLQNYALDEGEWSVSRPGRLMSGERAPGKLWIGGWVVSRAGLDRLKKTVTSAGNRITFRQLPTLFIINLKELC